MSSIDSFAHSLVGYFVGLPVYLPKEDIDGEFRCTTKQLLLGGGSGEHPAVVIEPLAAVARFLERELPNTNMSPELLEKWCTVYKPYLEYDDAKLLTFFEWKINTYHSFFERCHNSNTINSYHVYSDRMSLNEWLILGFGEFVFFSLPNLCHEIVSQLSDPYKQFDHVQFSNVLVVPPNMPVYSNRGNEFFPSKSGS